jgi:hypothetical protein
MKDRLILALLLSAICPAQAPQTAHCIFYRESALTGKALHAAIRIDSDATEHKLPSGKYWETDLPPGAHRIYSDQQRYGRNYVLQPGMTYYFRVEFRTNPPTAFGKLRFEIVPVEPDVADGEMSVLKADK